jgi:hypothetical protein
MLIIEHEHNGWSRAKLSGFVVVNHSKWTMLQGSTTVTLGMKIGHFFEFDRAFVRYRLRKS